MVVPVGPSKFYGSSLPRPRIYDDVKFNDHRVDPPPSVTDPLLSWAHEAHWAMGGLSFKRLRLQGKIEGNVQKLRAEREKIFKKLNRSPLSNVNPFRSEPEDVAGGGKMRSPVSPPPAPVAAKRKRFLAMIEDEAAAESEEEEEEVVAVNRRVRRRLVKKLGDDFDKVALATEKGKKGSPVKNSPERSIDSSRTRGSRRLARVSDDDVAVKKKGDDVAHSSPVVSGNRVRTSPRLSNKRTSS